jgi:hypothetical protein
MKEIGDQNMVHTSMAIEDLIRIIYLCFEVDAIQN